MQQNTKIVNEFFLNLTTIVADTASLGLCHPMGLGVLGLPTEAVTSTKNLKHAFTQSASTLHSIS